ncbi:MAG: hypothetical protein H0V29_10050, partial [Thermoleophilaceae bacterium]|nr:hypothetical protein [Thermoleophilaceae bacterium]
PPADWIERALAAAHRHPGAIVQGATRPDPDEGDLLYAGPDVHSQTIDPPGPWAETCNILYPRAVLESVGGFWEGPPVAAGEDTDLAFRARRSGADYVGAPEMLTFHAIEARGWCARIAGGWRWQHVALAVKRNPELRRQFTLGMFWNLDHALLPPALAGVLLAKRRRRWLLLCLPFLWQRLPSYGRGPRGLARAFFELPGRVLLTLVEFAGFARGSIRYRSPML